MKPSKEHVLPARKKLWSYYVTYRTKHNVTFEQYVKLHDDHVNKNWNPLFKTYLK
jgi:hypothetical protein